MASFNKVILMGNLTRDPEVRVTPNGLTICKFTVACNRKFKGSDGQEKEEVAYVDVDSFGKQAEVISKYFGGGKPILVEGRLRQDKWEDKTTKEKRSKLMVVLEGFSFVSGGRGEGGEGGSSGGGDFTENAPPARPAGRSGGNAGGASKPAPASDQIDEDVPF
jgi:single-strand DNA-binding protein